MPRFTRDTDAFLKRTMLPRVPECFFTEEDVALIAKETGMSPKTILHWASNLRWRSTHGGLGQDVTSVEDYLKASEEALAAKEPVVKVKRCYVSMFNAGTDLVENLTATRHLLWAYNEETGAAEVFMEFSEQVRTNIIRDRLAELGACSISVMTFQNNDGNLSAASALNRVRSVAQSEGFSEVVRGTCNAKLLAKADELAEADAAEEELRREFSEKTQAVLQLSIEETKGLITDGVSQITSEVSQIASAMATKEELSHLTGMTVSQNLQLKEIEETVITTAHNYVEHFKSQKKVIAKLNEQKESLSNENRMLHGELRKANGCLMKLLYDNRAIVKEKDEALKEKDEALKEKDKTIKMLHNRHTAFLITLAKRKEPEPDQ